MSCDIRKKSRPQLLERPEAIIIIIDASACVVALTLVTQALASIIMILKYLSKLEELDIIIAPDFVG